MSKKHKQIKSANAAPSYVKETKREDTKDTQAKTLPPLIKRATPEGKDYRIVIPENVEYIFRLFCAKCPEKEWSGVLFYELEGDFDSDSFKIICKDFLLNDIGSSTFTEFDDTGQAIDYIADKPELMSCYLGLTHSHNNMAKLFA